MIILTVGKGGVGKSTFSQALARTLHKSSGKVLLIDADPDGAVALTFNVDVGMKTIASMKETMKEERPRDAPDLEPLVQTTESGIDILVIGQGEDRGCYCLPNNRLRAGFSDLIPKYDVIVVDCHAGSEFISREVLKPDVIFVLTRYQHQASQYVAEQLRTLIQERGIPGNIIPLSIGAHGAQKEEGLDIALPLLDIDSLTDWLSAENAENLIKPVLPIIQSIPS